MPISELISSHTTSKYYIYTNDYRLILFFLSSLIDSLIEWKINN